MAETFDEQLTRLRALSNKAESSPHSDVYWDDITTADAKAIAELLNRYDALVAERKSAIGTKSPTTKGASP